jgi:PPOX class probable F420-dependent enzyme
MRAALSSTGVKGGLLIPESVRTVLESDKLAHVSTIDRDGSPHVTCAWVGVDRDEICIGTVSDQRKLQNIRHDPRVALSIETDALNPMGLKEYLVVYGRARITEGGAPELLRRLAATYLGPGVDFPPPGAPPGFVTRITPDRYGGVGPWASA